VPVSEWAAVAVEEPSLRPGDVIRLRIWREPDLSGEYPLDREGVVVLPKIGAVSAVDHTPAELEALVREEYARYLRNPSIEIVLLRRVNILGAVRSPGLYPVDPTMTLTDALAMAGGVLANGRQDRVELFRGDHRLVTEVTGQMRIQDLGLRSGDQLYVPERVWLSRNAGVIATVVSTVISATVSLIIAFSR
jgi:protein involved in polysaccharide export with SLBB domain